jgi:pimeloyl-ACP methyl ester carboxylesterase
MMPLIDRGDGIHLAYIHSPGQAPTIVFLPGFRSDMTGDKAVMLADFARAQGHAVLRLDYAGHGQSEGRFEDGTIGSWTQDALFLFDTLTAGPAILVGSSMGGWIALLMAIMRPERLRALVGIAAAPDFTEELMWASMDNAARDTLLHDGVLRIPNAYGGEQVITRALIEDGRHHLLLKSPIPIGCPVRLLQGQADADVPWRTALRIAEHLTSTDVEVTLIKDAGHRLSRPADLVVLRRLVAPFLGQNGA